MNGVLSTPLIGDLQRDGTSRLLEAGLSNAAWESREILAFALGATPAGLALEARRPASESVVAAWERMVSDRCSRRPLAYVLGEWDFCGLRLEVTPDVLVPRPETEELFGWAAEKLPPQLLSVADVGTGSGCLAIALAKRFPLTNVWAFDVSDPALAVARRNSRLHAVGNRVYCMKGDLLSRFSTGFALEAVVANLPYVDEKDMGDLSPEVKHEPSLALNGGDGGLTLVRRLLIQAWERLLPGGQVFLEVGHDQGPEASLMAEVLGFKTETRKDFAGLSRFVRGVK
jgi:release factor glutamine methyltransferase